MCKKIYALFVFCEKYLFFILPTRPYFIGICVFYSVFYKKLLDDIYFIVYNIKVRLQNTYNLTNSNTSHRLTKCERFEETQLPPTTP